MLVLQRFSSFRFSAQGRSRMSSVLFVYSFFSLCNIPLPPVRCRVSLSPLPRRQTRWWSRHIWGKYFRHCLNRNGFPPIPSLFIIHIWISHPLCCWMALALGKAKTQHHYSWSDCGLRVFLYFLEISFGDGGAYPLNEYHKNVKRSMNIDAGCVLKWNYVDGLLLFFFCVAFS